MNNDLISRESLLKKYCKEPAKGDCKNCDWFGDSWCRCEIFGVQIAEATAVDAIEVAHAKWEYTGSVLQTCQRCETSYNLLGGNRYKPWNYCPNCGAIMDLEE